MLNPASIALASAAGLLSFVSPCVLPLLPAYLSYIGGIGVAEVGDRSNRGRLLAGSILFVLGLATTFTLFGASASLVGQFLLEYQPIVLRIAGIIIMVLGLQMLGIVRLPFLERTLRPAGRLGGRGGAYLMGAAFGVGWTPCIGPFLSGVLALASQETTVAAGAVLLAAYALGLGVPFIIAGLAADRASTLVRGIGGRFSILGRLSGAVLILMGFLVFSGQMLWLSGVLSRVFGTGLTL